MVVIGREDELFSSEKQAIEELYMFIHLFLLEFGRLSPLLRRIAKNTGMAQNK